jgi:hypothetical protein
MKKFSEWLVRYWWIWPVACTAYTIVVCIPGLFPPKIDAIINKIGIFIELFLLFMQLLSFIYALKMKKNGKALGCLAAGFGWLIITTMFSGFYLLWEQSQPTGYAASHPILDSLEYNIPLQEIRVVDGDTVVPVLGIELRGTDTMYYRKGWQKHTPPTIDKENEQTWLQIWNSFQGGIYKYSFYYPELLSGTIYLRCFEVSKNEELSAKRLKEATSVDFHRHNKFGKIVDMQEFTIYEGDWGDYYAVRVEVWYHDPGKKEDRILMSKIYRMEGWMR